MTQKIKKQIKNFTNHVLSATGEYDIVTPPPEVKRSASLFPNYIFASIKQSDHLIFIERPRILSDLLIKFFNSQNLSAEIYFNEYEEVLI